MAIGASATLLFLGGGVACVLIVRTITSNQHDANVAGGAFALAFLAVALMWRVSRNLDRLHRLHQRLLGARRKGGWILLDGSWRTALLAAVLIAAGVALRVLSLAPPAVAALWIMGLTLSVAVIARRRRSSTTDSGS
jgi:hypothetical protein